MTLWRFIWSSESCRRIRETDTFSIKQECILEHDATLDLLYGGNKFSLERDWRSEIGVTTVSMLYLLRRYLYKRHRIAVEIKLFFTCNVYHGSILFNFYHNNLNIQFLTITCFKCNSITYFIFPWRASTIVFVLIH